MKMPLPSADQDEISYIYEDFFVIAFGIGNIKNSYHLHLYSSVVCFAHAFAFGIRRLFVMKSKISYYACLLLAEGI